MQNLAPPSRLPQNPAIKIIKDITLRRATARRGELPPGPRGPRATLTFMREPLAVLLPAYERYGPVFTVPLLHVSSVWAVGPEAQHDIFVVQADRLKYRDGAYRELVPLLGNGLITTDGEYHDRCRRLMMPAFRTERIAETHAAIVEETARALAQLSVGETFDAYEWVRTIGMRVAMRDLFGLDPDDQSADELTREFARGMSFFGAPIFLWALRGPITPYGRMLSARRRLERVVTAIVHARRANTARSDRHDILSLLIGSEDTDGTRFTDSELVDHAMTLLFAAHDTTSIATAMLLYELARHPSVTSAIQLELDRTGDRQDPVPLLSCALEETMRLHPPVPAGGRRAVQDLYIAGTRIPEGAWVNWCSWASHRLPEIFPDPLAFRPERMAADARTFPPGAYVPFGGGSRICIGKRFALLEATTIAASVLRHFSPQIQPTFEPRLRWKGTLMPQRGLPMQLHPR
jgi:cytochrome P450